MLFLFGNASAQDWQPFNESKSYFLSQTSVLTEEPLVGFVLDEVISLKFGNSSLSGDTAFLNPVQMIGCDLKDANSPCFNRSESCTELFSFIGNSPLKTSDYWMVTNRNLDNLTFPMQPQDSFEVLSINDTSYILTKFFTGEETVTEEIDSVIYYKIVSIDSVGQVLANQWQNDTVILSKKHGFIQTPSWYLFPNFHTKFNLIDQNNKGVLEGLTHGAVYDYNVGDMIQSVEESEEGHIITHEFISKSKTIKHCVAIEKDTSQPILQYRLSCEVHGFDYQFARSEHGSQYLKEITSEIYADTLNVTSNQAVIYGDNLRSGWIPMSLKKVGDGFEYSLNSNSESSSNYQGCYLIQEAFEPYQNLSQYGVIGMGPVQITNHYSPNFPSTYKSYWFNLTYFKSDSIEYGSPGWPIGLDEVVTENRVTLFPNPVQTVLHIQSDEPVLSAHIYSISGTLINSFSSQELVQHQLDLSSLASGIYLLQLQLENRTETHRLVK